MAHLSEQLKAKGNDAFRRGEYVEAEDFYTQAIQKHASNPLLFTNRANVRLKLHKWEEAVLDCTKAVEITGEGVPNHKAYYFLAQAHLSCNHPQLALTAAQTAYTQVLYPAPTTKSSPTDLQTFSLFVLRCKKALFTSRERARLRAQGDLLADLEESLDLKLQSDLAAISSQLHKSSTSLPTGASTSQPMGPIAATEAHAALHAAHATQLSGLRAVFALAQDPSLTPPRREVPDHLVDMITFEPMHDPVVTKNGHSYERATLYEHLKRSPTDPMTREPLGIEELRSNLGLRSACEEFWAGGAGEWIGDW